MTHRLRRVAGVLVTLLFVAAGSDITSGYSVLTHEAIIDVTWEKGLQPLLLTRFPSATPDQLRGARAHAYGGAIIQDMGYYPFGSPLFSDLTHYVRSGDFVQALLRDAEDLDEFAFALGALCHYSADNDGHAIATNPAVPLLYPKLQRRFGNTVTYDDNPTAHIRTEFGFDVLEIAQGHFAPGAFHDVVGFKVSKHLLERAFKDTYGIKLSSIFTSLDLALGSYRYSVSTLLPTMTRVAWQTHRAELAKRTPGVTQDQFLYKRSPAEFDREFGTQYKKPGFLSKTLAFLLRIIPKIGPLKGFSIEPSTPETERLFVRSFDATVVAYRATLVEVGAGELHLRNTNLDTGRPTLTGDYHRADRAYAQMLDRLASHHFDGVTTELRDNITAFYGDSAAHVPAKSERGAWQKTLRALTSLRTTDALLPEAAMQAPVKPAPAAQAPAKPEPAEKVQAPPLFPKHRRGLYLDGLGREVLDATPQAPPLDTDDPGVPEKGVYEINFSTRFDFSRNARSVDLFSVDANYGLLPKIGGRELPMQFTVAMPLAGAKVSGQPFAIGPGATEIGLKLNFYNSEHHRIEMAFYPQIEFTLGSRSADKGLADPGQTLHFPLLISKKFDYFTLVVNGAMDKPLNDPDRRITGTFGVGVGLSLTRHFVIMTELHSESRFTSGEDRLLTVNVGLMHAIRHSLVFYTNVGHSLMSDDGLGHTYLGAGLKVLIKPSAKVTR